jgi:hypothetical protein
MSMTRTKINDWRIKYAPSAHAFLQYARQKSDSPPFVPISAIDNKTVHLLAREGTPSPANGFAADNWHAFIPQNEEVILVITASFIMQKTGSYWTHWTFNLRSVDEAREEYTKAMNQATWKASAKTDGADTVFGNEVYKGWGTLQ